MKRKIIASIIVIVLVVVSMIGGTLAWFTDADSTPENTFQAGILSMDVNDNFPYEDKTFENFEPGTTVPKDINVTNNGTKREFLRAMVTETLTQKLHFFGDGLVQYLPAYDSNGMSTHTAGTFAATLDTDNNRYILAYNLQGRPVLWSSLSDTEGYVEVYVIEYDSDATSGTNLVQAAFPASKADSFTNGINPSDIEDYQPVVKDYMELVTNSNTVDGFGIYRELTTANWLTTTLHGVDTSGGTPPDVFDGSGFPHIEWYYDNPTAVEFDSSNMYTRIGNWYYFNQALYPAGYDGTPDDGNDNPSFNATIAPFLSDVAFVSTALDNIYQGSVYQLKVDFETIQVTNGAAADQWGAVFSANLETSLAANVTGTWAAVEP